MVGIPTGNLGIYYFSISIWSYFAFKCCNGGCEWPPAAKSKKIFWKFKSKAPSVVSQNIDVTKSNTSQPEGSEQVTKVGDGTGEHQRTQKNKVYEGEFAQPIHLVSSQNDIMINNDINISLPLTSQKVIGIEKGSQPGASLQGDDTQAQTHKTFMWRKNKEPPGNLGSTHMHISRCLILVMCHLFLILRHHWQIQWCSPNLFLFLHQNKTHLKFLQTLHDWQHSNVKFSIFETLGGANTLNWHSSCWIIWFVGVIIFYFFSSGRHYSESSKLYKSFTFIGYLNCQRISIYQWIFLQRIYLIHWQFSFDGYSSSIDNYFFFINYSLRRSILNSFFFSNIHWWAVDSFNSFRIERGREKWGEDG